MNTFSKTLAILVTLLSLASQTFCFSDTKSSALRIGADYTKTLVHDGVVLVYGNNGVILTSSNYGIKWQRATIPGLNNYIKNIVIRNNLLYAANANGTIFCADPTDIKWARSDVSVNDSIINMFANNETNTLAVVTKTQLIFYDVSDQVIGTKSQIDEDFVGAYQIKSVLFINTKRKTYKVDMKNINTFSEIAHPAFLHCAICSVPSLIQAVGDSLLICYDDDYYITDSSLTSGRYIMTSAAAFCYNGNDLISIKVDNATQPDHGLLFRTVYNLHASGDMIIDTATQRDEYAIGQVYLSSLSVVNDSIMIGVGQYNTIIRSSDRGWSWYFVSYLRGDAFPVMKDSLFGVLSERTRVTHTYDGNCTWLPQRVSSDTSGPGWYDGGVVSFVDDGLIVMITNTPQVNSNKLVRYTLDSGQTIHYETVSALNWTTLDLANQSSIRHDSSVYIYRTFTEPTNSGSVRKFTIRAEFDTAMRYKGYVLTDSTSLGKIFVRSDTIYSIGQLWNTSNYSRVCLLCSTDFGVSWTPLQYADASLRYIYTTFVVGNFMYYGSSGVVAGHNWSQLQYAEIGNGSNYGLCFKDTVSSIYNVCLSDDKVYYGGKYGMNVSEKSNDVMTKWVIDSTAGRCTYYVNTATEKYIEAYIGYYNASGGTTVYYCRLNKDDLTSEIKNKESLEVASSYINSVYPDPCSHLCVFKYYHDDQKEVKVENVHVYDLEGNEVSKNEVSINVNNDTSYLSSVGLECSKLTRGVYIVKVETAYSVAIQKFVKY